MRTFFKFQKWWFLKGAEFLIIIAYFLVPYLIASAYFAGFSTMFAMVGIIAFFVGALQLTEWSDFKRDMEHKEWLLVHKLKGSE